MNFEDQPDHKVPAPTPVRGTTVELTDSMLTSIRSTGPWLRLFSIFGFIGSGLMIMGGLFMFLAGIFGAAFGEELGGGVVLVGMSFLYLALAVVYVFPSLFLFRAAGGVVDIKRGRVRTGVETALKNQKSFWKFIGVFMIIFICLYPIMIAVVVLGAFAGSL